MRRTPPARYKTPTASHDDPVSMKHRVLKCCPLSSQFASATRFIASAVSPQALGLGHGLRIRECKEEQPCNSRPVSRNMKTRPKSPSLQVLHETAFPGMLDRVSYVLHVVSPSLHGTEKHYFLLAVTGTTAHRKKRANARGQIGCD
jgi:hypothetical protein